MEDFAVIFRPTDTSNAPPDIDTLAQDFQASDWSIPEAFMALILGAAFADHDLAPEERQEIAALIKRSRTMKRLSDAELAAVNQTVNARLNERESAIAEACHALPVDMRVSVFAHCVDITLADGKLLESEAKYLNEITHLLGLEETRAREVMAVIMHKNRY